MKLSKNTVKNIGKKWFVCLIFSFCLLIIVFFSEIFRRVIEDITPNPYTLSNILYFFLMVFVLVPFSLLAMWRSSPLVIEKLFKKFGLSEELKKEEKKNGNDNETVKEKKKEKNDFLELVKKHSDTVTEKDLQILLEKRLELPSKSLTTNVTVFIMVLVALIPPSIPIFESMSLIAIILFLAALYAFLVYGIYRIILQAKQRGKDEETLMENYLQAKKRLEEIKAREERSSHQTPHHPKA